MSLGGNARSIDLGCGPNKVENCFGVDSYQFEEVDLVCDLNKFPWPIEDDSFEVVYARQIIEHVDDAVGFLKEIHRIAKNDAEVHIETPHFSAASSWGISLTCAILLPSGMLLLRVLSITCFISCPNLNLLKIQFGFLILISSVIW